MLRMRKSPLLTCSKLGVLRGIHRVKFRYKTTFFSLSLGTPSDQNIKRCNHSFQSLSLLFNKSHGKWHFLQRHLVPTSKYFQGGTTFETLADFISLQSRQKYMHICLRISRDLKRLYFSTYEAVTNFRLT